MNRLSAGGIGMVAAVLTVGGMGMLSGCASSPPQQSTERYLNFDDVKQTIQASIGDCLSKPWRDRFAAANPNRPPIIGVYPIRNRTDKTDITDTMLTQQVQRELLNAGIEVVTTREDLVRGIRDYTKDDANRDPAYAKKLKAEAAADYFLTGEMDYVRTSETYGTLKGYQISFELVDLETMKKVWIDVRDVRKVFN